MSELFDDLPAVEKESRIKSGVVKIRKDKDFASISNKVLNDRGLSAESLGVVSYLLSKPDGWKIMNHEISDRFQIGRDKLQRIFREVETAGYLFRQQVKLGDGTWGWIRHLSESKTIPPLPEKAVMESPQPCLPATGEPSTENTASYKERLTKTDIQKKNLNLPAEAGGGRHKAFLDIFNRYWGKFNQIPLSMNGREGKALKKFLSDNPSFKGDDFYRCMVNRAKSPATVHSQPIHTVLADIMDYANGPLDRFHKPLGAGEPKTHGERIRDKNAESAAKLLAARGLAAPVNELLPDRAGRGGDVDVDRTAASLSSTRSPRSS